jgi:hypothetical protein
MHRTFIDRLFGIPSKTLLNTLSITN